MDYQEIKENFICITPKQAEFLDEIVKKVNPNSKVVLMDVTSLFKQLLSGKNQNNDYTPYTLIRLLTDKLELPDKILYLDISAKSILFMFIFSVKLLFSISIMFVKSLLLSCELLYYAITFYVLRAFNIAVSYTDLFFVICGTSFAITACVFIPTPGGSGGIEFAFTSIFVFIASGMIFC